MLTGDVTKIGIVIPTRWEAGDVLSAFKFKKRSDGLYEASVAGKQVLLCLSGVGLEAARVGAERLCEAGVKMLVSAGFCGALSPDLKVGDVVSERLMTVKDPARNRSEREAISKRANAVAVDMETQAVVEVGTLRAVPIRTVRVISDTVDDDLTPLFGSSGKFSPVGIAFRLLNPSVWPLARQLSANSKIAKKNLVLALQQFLH